MKVILSIKPEFANEIFNGKKKYEYRKIKFKKDVDTIIVYVSSPVKKVIGEFRIEDIISDDINILWQKTKKESGINEDYFFRYFANREIGHAIKIGKTKRYSSPMSLERDFGLHPPQSFLYFEGKRVKGDWFLSMYSYMKLIVIKTRHNRTI